ncbi:MAG: SDR family oxidoreductase [Alphaproteobacteria bacterium]|nr:SDR family oxidoreductase [Alphaproteobacteria bacterium]
MTGLMAGKKGLIMGVANKNSIAWGIAKALSEAGAEIAFSYQGENLEKRVRPLAQSINQDFLIPCDVTDKESMDGLFNTLKGKWGKIDFVVHAIAFSDKEQLKGAYMDTTADNFSKTMLISCYSFTDVCKRASEIMNDGGSLLSLTYLGAERYVSNYNVMGVAKAALEASIHYLAKDLGERNIRVNAISAGPVKTLAAGGIGDFRYIFNWNKTHSPLGKNVTIEDIGGTAVYLLSTLSSGVTGERIHVDGGYNFCGTPFLDKIKDGDLGI